MNKEFNIKIKFKRGTDDVLINSYKSNLKHWVSQLSYIKDIEIKEEMNRICPVCKKKDNIHINHICRKCANETYQILKQLHDTPNDT